MNAGIDCVLTCSKIWRSNARLPPGKPLQLTVRPASTAAERSSAVAASHVNSKPTAITRSPSHAPTATALPVRRVIFPLDKHLALLPGRLTPLLQDHLTHLSCWMPFAKAAALLTSFTHTSTSESTAQRLTETIGLAYEAVQLAEVDRIERDWPEVEQGPDKLVLSLDGAFVPLVHGEWTEVKTLVVGEVAQPKIIDGKEVVSTHSHSYFSRVAEAELFQRLTLGELYRRGVETAAQLASVSDGAEWIQGFIDFQAPNATRILDFPHAAQRICQIGEALLGAEHTSLRAWQQRQLHDLKHQGVEQVLERLRSLAAGHESVEVVGENLAYLEKRVAQMQYPRFQRAGWPIGSGLVESANKVVVEARLKGAGMHWSRASVNPLLALRTAVCNDRWGEAWRQSAAHIRCFGRQWRAVEPKRKVVTPLAQETDTSLPAVSARRAVSVVKERKPAADHPWRRTYQATKARLAQAGPNARK